MPLPTCECANELGQLELLRAIYCGIYALTGGDVGDATAGNQVLEIAQLEAINGNTDALPSALGQALMAASLPVVIASNQTSFPVTIAAGAAVIGHVIVDSGVITTVGAVTAITNALPAGNNNIGDVDVASLPSQGYGSKTTITRPANVTPYTAGDVLGGALTIATMGASGGDSILTNAFLLPQIAAIPAGMTSFRLHLYSATPPSAIADNGVWTFDAGDQAVYLGYVDLGSPADFGAGLFVQAVPINLQIKLVASTSVFGYLVTNGGFTPAANSEVYLLNTRAVGV